MTAYFPNGVRPFVAKVDLQDTIAAEHINSLQEEVRAIQLALQGTGVNGLLTSTFSGTFSTTGNGESGAWATLDDRISNIEIGLVNGLAISPYVKKAGDSMTVSNTTALTLKNSSATTTANLFEAYNSTNTLGFALTGAGLPKVGTANVLYVGSTDYNTLNTTANTALSVANSNPFDPFLLAGM